ncbi:MAG TPA: bifunctional riboflavin kinase/FMN adenylyltransferase [Candidatus Eisenbacteria bacterium]|nr:bifunctional riboflavin kinase/FMN adenylyltransferase [Candidatus Eisenbacteria bacterium]
MSLTNRPIALTIGVFDGLHRGHQAIVAAVVKAARERGGAAWVATFDPHPDAVVRGTEERPWITPPEERAALLHGLGVDRVEVIRFDRSVSALLPEEFLDRILGPNAPLSTLVVGPDFKMGRGRVGDRAYLEALGRKRGFEVVEVPLLPSGTSPRASDPPAGSAPSPAASLAPSVAPSLMKISSTQLRRAIEEGRMEDAEALMGRPYALEGTVGSGAGRGTDLGFPTANLEIHPKKLLPPAGIYLSENEMPGGWARGLTYVGSAPTFGPGPTRVEVFLVDYQGSLRGLSVKTLLRSKLRADKAFGSSEELVRAMREDVARAREFWARSAPEAAPGAGGSHHRP